MLEGFKVRRYHVPIDRQIGELNPCLSTLHFCTPQIYHFRCDVTELGKLHFMCSWFNLCMIVLILACAWLVCCVKTVTLLHNNSLAPNDIKHQRRQFYAVILYMVWYVWWCGLCSLNSDLNFTRIKVFQMTRTTDT